MSNKSFFVISNRVRNLSSIVTSLLTLIKLSFQITSHPGSFKNLSFQINFGALTAGRPRLWASRGVYFLFSFLEMPNGTGNLQGAQPKDCDLSAIYR